MSFNSYIDYFLLLLAQFCIEAVFIVSIIHFERGVIKLKQIFFRQKISRK